MISQGEGAGAGVTKLLLADGHGSTRLAADSAGNVVAHYDYDAFGNARGFDPSAAATILLYTGEQYDAGVQEYYLRARYYSPAVGSFTSMDSYAGTLSEPASLHKYLYANANPVMYSDPTGMWTYVDTLCTVSVIAMLTAIIEPPIYHAVIIPARLAAAAAQAVPLPAARRDNVVVMLRQSFWQNEPKMKSLADALQLETLHVYTYAPISNVQGAHIKPSPYALYVSSNLLAHNDFELAIIVFAEYQHTTGLGEEGAQAEWERVRREIPPYMMTQYIRDLHHGNTENR